jgi:hypothetical protein
MTVAKEYWNIPKAYNALSISQVSNLTVFVEDAKKCAKRIELLLDIVEHRMKNR